MSLRTDRLLGLNLGKNKTSLPSSHTDYLDGVEALGSFADYLVINISSPNTPGLRSLQRREPIQELLSQAIQVRNDKLPHHPPLLVKISPDCSDEELKDIAEVCLHVGIDGVIVGNTTISRPESLKTSKEIVQEAGGLSGIFFV